MDPSTAFLPSILAAAILATAALVLRARALARPDPRRTGPTGTLSEMMVGVLSWATLAFVLLIGAAGAGVYPALATAAALLLAARVLPRSADLTRFYGLQLPFAAAALAAAILAGLQFLAILEGISHV